MDFLGGIVIWAGVAVAAAVLGGVLAGIKNRDYSSWIAWSFLLPPIALVLLLLPRLEGPRPRQPRLDESERGSW
ncbi:hypothetical protein [Hyphomicrobium sulfonivorans]|uniref:hypothetical protein n=1 Tax=Hyphomicrobium sulfonivorans TaxID=121290 RepID=UPI00156D9A97|nr:hypothetical protein [Hyphomicrobium sulfonivorans]MBI1649749.1 hypothetical protein [Hyphomicrobium sulfonivorans]NSL71665.1 hypothetical protein [Hyphomicrobium sulfonivorans]